MMRFWLMLVGGLLVLGAAPEEGGEKPVKSEVENRAKDNLSLPAPLPQIEVAFSPRPASGRGAGGEGFFPLTGFNISKPLASKFGIEDLSQGRPLIRPSGTFSPKRGEGDLQLSLQMVSENATPKLPQGEKEQKPETPTKPEAAVKPVAPANPADPTMPKVVVRGRAGTLERLPARPMMSPEDRVKLIAKLREAYTQPPEKWPAPTVDEGVRWKELGTLPKEVKSPDDNPWTKEKSLLGKQFFFDPRLSSSGQIACASCHDPDLGWADGRTTGFGHARKALRRNTPTIMNAALNDAFFWDGRAPSLEHQALKVMLNPDEMHSSKEHVKKLLDEVPAYKEGLKKAFAVEEPGIQQVAAAIAAFERTVIGGRSTFDLFLKTKKIELLSDEAVVGLDLYRTTARCMNCHHGPNFTDNQFHNLGLSYYGRSLEDLGRYGITEKAEDVGRFKTPTLRNISRTAPYMHNGIFPLVGVLNLYNGGMPTLLPKPEQADDPIFPKAKSPHLRPLGLNKQDITDLVKFLESLEEPRQRVRPPSLPGLHELPAPPDMSAATEEKSEP